MRIYQICLPRKWYKVIILKWQIVWRKFKNVFLFSILDCPSHLHIPMQKVFLVWHTSSKSRMSISRIRGHGGPHRGPKTTRDTPKVAAFCFVRLIMLVWVPLIYISLCRKFFWSDLPHLSLGWANRASTAIGAWGCCVLLCPPYHIILLAITDYGISGKRYITPSNLLLRGFSVHIKVPGKMYFWGRLHLYQCHTIFVTTLFAFSKKSFYVYVHRRLTNLDWRSHNIAYAAYFQYLHQPSIWQKFLRKLVKFKL